MRPGALRLSLKFGLVLFGIVAGALTIVYLAVVPMLESRLVNAKIADLERASMPIVEPVASEQIDFGRLADLFESTSGARVVIFGKLDERSLSVLADSRGLRPGSVERDRIALEAAETGRAASGRVTRGGSELAEVARPAGPDKVILLSASLADALTNVRNVQRTLLIAGLSALVVSWLAGYLLAWRFSRRIGRLEEAAERIAAGDFEAPVVDSGQDEVGQLAHAFDSMRVRLAHLDHVRREFIANASHELRTPLFSLGGFLELLADEDLDDTVRREFVLEMAGQVERLTKLATDLLDLSRLDAGQLAVGRAELDLAATARVVAEEFRAVAEAGEHELRTDADDPVLALGDEQRVVQIARILVENALRHTPAGTTVEVIAAERDGRAVLSVRDEGPGIAADHQEHLFERFYRADGGKASGSGLGLAIASELAARMEGAIELRSRPGETVFTLVLTRPEGLISRQNAEVARPTEAAPI